MKSMTYSLRSASIWLAIAAVVLGGWAAGRARAQGRGDSAQDNGAARAVYELLQTHRFSEAESEAQHALAADPKNCTLDLLLGIAQNGQGKDQQAFQSFNAAVRLCPENLAALEGAAQIAYRKHLPETADLLKRIVALRPEDPTVNAMMGAVEAEAGHCEAAVDSYSRARLEESHSLAAVRQDAGCLAALGRTKEAESLLQNAMAGGAFAADADGLRMMLAEVENRAGQQEAALGTLAPLLGAQPPRADVLRLAAAAAEAENDTPKAVAWLRQAMAAKPRDPAAYLEFAEVSFNHGSFDVGVDILNVGLKELPGNARLLLARGVLEVQLSKFDAALEDFRAAEDADPRLSLADDAVGVLFSQKHDTTAALALFREKSRANPRDPFLQYLYAEALSESPAETGGLDQAIAAAEKAVALEPDYAAARDLLCILLLRRGDAAGALDQANTALKQNPYDETALYQGLLASKRLQHPTQDWVKRLREAKQHNQVAVTKYMLEETDKASRATP